MLRLDYWYLILKFISNMITAARRMSQQRCSTTIRMNQELWDRIRIACSGYNYNQNEYMVRALELAVDSDLKRLDFEQNRRALQLQQELQDEFLSVKPGMRQSHERETKVRNARN
jgi:hypothetical protein